jgi:uncharacterized membrane protein YeaQ/YmgE (transglycosylase-associated protein family)
MAIASRPLQAIGPPPLPGQRSNYCLRRRPADGLRQSKRLRVAAAREIAWRVFHIGNFSGGDALACDYRREDIVMYLSNQSLLVILVVGIVAGWLAGRVMEGGGFGLIGDLIVGLIGAFIGDWLLPRVGIHLGVGIVGLIVNAFIGAVVLLLILRLVSGGGWGFRRHRWGRRW